MKRRLRALMRLRPLPAAGIADRGLSARASLAIFTVCVCIAIGAVFACSAIYERNAAIATARLAAKNLTDSLAQQASDAFEAVDSALLGLTERVETDGTGPAAREKLRDMMAAQLTTMSRLHLLTVIDARGRYVVGNESSAPRPDLHFERAPYFRFHRAHPGSTVHISGPEWNAAMHSWLIDETRRIDAPNGTFAGVTLAQIPIDYFEQIYSSLDVGRSGVIALTADDGTVLVRHPARFIGRRVRYIALFTDAYKFLPAGYYTSTSRIDGVTRLFAFRRLGRYPVIADVGLSADEYLAGWRTAASNSMLALAAVLLLIAGLARALDVQIQKRRGAEESLARLALVDGLTGLANRRQFDEVLDREWRLAERRKSPLALLMIDVDEFKAYNDGNGHQRGDDVLMLIASTIAGSLLRARDCCARYGGEEFAAILPDTSAEDAMAVADRIRRTIAALGVPHESSSFGTLTVSVGVCSAVPNRGERQSALIEAADNALYAAKRAGRNRTRAATGGLGAPRSAGTPGAPYGPETRAGGP